MSELKVNTITGLGGQITITDPVAIGGSAQSGYELTVAGKTKTSQSIDVVTVAVDDFGVRIRAPFSSTTSPGFGDSTIQFTSNIGTEYASIHAKNTSSLGIKTNGAERVTIDSVGTVTHAYKTVLVGDTTVNGIATFSPVPVCATQCSLSTQLANKAYVDGKPTYTVLPQSTSASDGGSVGQQFAWHYGIGNYSVVFSGGCWSIVLPANTKWNFVSWHQTPYRVTGGAHGFLFQQYMSDSRSGTFVANGSLPVSSYMYSGKEQNWGFITRI